MKVDGSTFPFAFAASVFLNLGLWYTLSLGAHRVARSTEPDTIEVQRIVIPEVKPKVTVVKRQPKVAPPKPVEQRHPKPPAEKAKVKAEPPKPAQRPASKPKPDAHNRVLTAPPDPNGSGDGVRPGGKADPGKPLDHQGNGDATTDTPPKVPDPAKPPEAPKPPAKPPAQPQPTAPPNKPVEQPKPPETPKPKGPTKDAEPLSQVLPAIPDDLKSQDLSTFVRVKVEIRPDGSYTVALRTSSGKPEVDRLILAALKKWKWAPALKDGDPVQSTQYFKFEIEVR